MDETASFESDREEMVTRMKSVEIIHEEIQEQQNNDNEEKSERRKWLERECQRQAHLDGKYFEVDFEKSDENESGAIESICKMCPDSAKEKRIRGHIKVSSNFTKHLKRAHPDQEQDFEKYKKQKLNDYATQKKMSTCEFSQKQFNENLTNVFMASPSVPLSLVQQKQLKKLLADMKIKENGRPLRLMCRQTLNQNMRKQHKMNLERIKKKYQQMQNSCAQQLISGQIKFAEFLE